MDTNFRRLTVQQKGSPQGGILYEDAQKGREAVVRCDLAERLKRGG